MTRTRPVFRGDHDGDDATQWLSHLRTDPADGTTITFGGVSDVGLPDDAVPPWRPDGERFADPRTWRNHRQLPAGPDDLPAINPRDTGPLQRLPRISRVKERPRPVRPADAAIFIWSTLLGQHIMKCGVCLRSRYADPIAGHMPFTFEALRVSAYVSGWRLDAFARWACPACQATPTYRTPYPVTHSHPELRRLHAAGRPVDEAVARTVLAADPYAEFAVTEAEHDLILDVARATRHGRHAVGAS